MGKCVIGNYNSERFRVYSQIITSLLKFRFTFSVLDGFRALCGCGVSATFNS